MSVKEYSTSPVKSTQRDVVCVSGVMQFPMDANTIIVPTIVHKKSHGIDHTSVYAYSSGAHVELTLDDYFPEFLYGSFTVHDNGLNVAKGDGSQNGPERVACPYVTSFNHTFVVQDPHDTDLAVRGRKANRISLQFTNLVTGHGLTPLALADTPANGGGFKELYFMLWFRNSEVA